MSNLIIFLGGFSVSLVGLALLARSLWWDDLKKQPDGKAHALLLIPQVFRHLGLLAIVPEVVGEPLTRTTFAKTLAYGDALVAPLALLAMWLWLSGSKAARPFAWAFGIFASLDLANAIFGALTLPVTNYGIGAFWLVLTCLVPLVIVAQIMTFVRLAKS